MPWTQITAGILLTLMFVVAVEIAEVGARLNSAALRYSDRLDPAPRQRVADRLGGLAIAVAVTWFFALPWVVHTAEPAAALLLFVATFGVGTALLRRVQLASVRYPAATAAPLLAIAAAAAVV